MATADLEPGELAQGDEGTETKYDPLRGFVFDPSTVGADPVDAAAFDPVEEAAFDPADEAAFDPYTIEPSFESPVGNPVDNGFIDRKYNDEETTEPTGLDEEGNNNRKSESKEEETSDPLGLLPDNILIVTQAFVMAANKTQISAAQLCELFHHSLSEKIPISSITTETKMRPREATMVRDKDNFYINKGNPMFGDSVYLKQISTGDGVDVNNNNMMKLGYIRSVHTVPNSYDLRRVTINLDHSVNRELLYDIFGDSLQMDETTTLKQVPIQLHQFTLTKSRISANCGPNATRASLISKFVQKLNNNSLQKFVGEEEYQKVMESQNSPDLFDNLVAAITAVMQRSMHKQSEDTLQENECPEGGENVDGVCTELFSEAVRTAGDVPRFDAYTKNNLAFRKSFESFVENKNITNAFCAFFVVTRPSYTEIYNDYIGAWTDLARKLTPNNLQLVKQLSQVVFQGYIIAINNIKIQHEGLSQLHIAGLMWLLFFTQLPPVITKFISMMAAQINNGNIAKDFLNILRQFHSTLKREIIKFLPSRPELMQQYEQEHYNMNPSEHPNVGVILYDFIRTEFEQTDNFLIRFATTALARSA